MMMLESAFFQGLLQSEETGEVVVPGFGTGTVVEEDGVPEVVSVVEVVVSVTSGIFDPEA